VKKIGLLCLAVVLALGTVGMGFAWWSETLEIGQNPINTGDLDATFCDGLMVPGSGLTGAGMVSNDDGGNGFYFHFYSPTILGDPWPYHYIGIWAGTYNRLGSQGAHWFPPAESRSYYMRYTTYGGAAQPVQSFTMELKLIASENDDPLEVWAQANLPANDCLFDDVNEIVYHKLADGSSVETIAFADFDYEGWLASWPTD